MIELIIWQSFWMLIIFILKNHDPRQFVHFSMHRRQTSLSEPDATFRHEHLKGVAPAPIALGCQQIFAIWIMLIHGGRWNTHQKVDERKHIWRKNRTTNT